MNDIEYLRSVRLDSESVKQGSMLAYIVGGLIGLTHSGEPITAKDLANVVRFAEQKSKKIS